MSGIPVNIRVLREQCEIQICWTEEDVQEITFFDARAKCPCASCVDEFTGMRRLDPSTVPKDVHPLDVKFSGNYALKISWSDGHDTGLYTWDALRNLGSSEG